MKELLIRTYVSWKIAPLVLRLIVLFCLTGFLFMVGPLLPFGTFEIEGIRVTQEQFWRSGAGFGMTLTGVALVTVAIGILRRKPWARPALVLLVPFAYLIHTVLGLSGWQKLGEELLWCIAFPVLPLSMYLYLTPAVKYYFHEEDKARTSA